MDWKVQATPDMPGAWRRPRSKPVSPRIVSTCEAAPAPNTSAAKRCIIPGKLRISRRCCGALKGRAPVFLAGFSLGGNVVLKLAGELGEAAKGLIAGVTAVSTPIDLAACARRLQARSNFIYSNRFLKPAEAAYPAEGAADARAFPARRSGPREKRL